MQDAVIPLSTLLLNVPRDLLKPSKVRIKSNNSEDIVCDVNFVYPVEVLTCDVDNIVTIKMNKLQVVVGKKVLMEPLFVFEDIQVANFVDLPQRYRFPFPLNWIDGMSMHLILTHLYNQYFALDVSFRVLSQCIAPEHVTLDGCMITDESKKHNFEIRTYKVKNKNEILAVTQFGKLLFDFNKATISFGDKFLFEPHVIYGGKKTSKTPIIRDDFRCTSAIQPMIGKSFPYERGLRFMQFQSQIADNVSLKTTTETSQSDWIPRYSVFVENLLIKTENPCVVDFLKKYLYATSPNERTFVALKTFFVHEENVRKHMANVEKMYPKMVDLLQNWSAQEEEHKSNVNKRDALLKKRGVVDIWETIPFGDLTASQWMKFVDENITTISLKTTNDLLSYAKTTIIPLQKSLRESFPPKSKERENLETIDANIIERRTMLQERQKFLQQQEKQGQTTEELAKEIAALDKQLAKFETLKEERKQFLQDNERLLSVLEMKPNLTKEEENVQKKLLALLPKDLTKEEPERIAEGETIFHAQILAKAEEKFVHDMKHLTKSKEAKEVFSELPLLQKKIWFLKTLKSTQNFNYSNYDHWALRGFVKIWNPPCAKEIKLLLL